MKLDDCTVIRLRKTFHALHIQLIRHFRLLVGEQMRIAVGDVYALMPHPVRYGKCRKSHFNQ